ncbi:MAG: hypothetical protein AAF821_07660 [Cyanobacteria bacterium P01_D01_bin.156]
MGLIEIATLFAMMAALAALPSASVALVIPVQFVDCELRTDQPRYARSQHLLNDVNDHQAKLIRNTLVWASCGE